MRTPAQALKDAIASGAVEAWNRGEPIRHKHAFTERDWVVLAGNDKEAPLFDNVSLTWSPAPTKRRIPFTQLTIPKGALWRINREDAHAWHVPKCYGTDSIHFLIGSWTYVGAAEELLYSTDGGVTWQPGSLEVES